MADRISPERRSANMRAIRSSGMTPEMIVRRAVFGLGYRYRLHCKDLPGTPDLVFRRRQRIIFVHGCFWHQHKGCKRGKRTPRSNVAYWRTKLVRNAKRDRMQLNDLRAKGWKVLVIWECETKDIVVLKKRLRSFLQTTHEY